ncbi:peptide deformylase [Candidatus Gottesmanbacteria bacterium]|nr:peptide deformylase [Candidatus Gottesmanbacteria bacterium]
MKILTTPNPILTHPAKPVEKIDKKVLEFIEEMKKTLLATENPKGVGLAAPQLAKPWQIFIARPIVGSKPSKIQVFINPEIIWKSKELTEGVPERETKQSPVPDGTGQSFSSNKLEGCLSIPGIWGYIKRHQTIKLKYKTPDNKTHTKKFSGFLATIIQHEMDHLEGRLFSARVLEQHGKFFKIEKNVEGKETLQEMRLDLA